MEDDFQRLGPFRERSFGDGPFPHSADKWGAGRAGCHACHKLGTMGKEMSIFGSIPNLFNDSATRHIWRYHLA
jgi:hypothetical protein